MAATLKKLEKLPLTNKNVGAFSEVYEMKLDKQGRIFIPQNLIEYGEIEKEIVNIGVSNKIKIWSRKNWDEYNSSNIDYDNIAEQINELEF